MRLNFEERGDEYFLDVILNDRDLEHIKIFGGIIESFLWENPPINNINIYLSKERGVKECHLSKEKQQKREKGSVKT